MGTKRHHKLRRRTTVTWAFAYPKTFFGAGGSAQKAPCLDYTGFLFWIRRLLKVADDGGGGKQSHFRPLGVKAATSRSFSGFWMVS